jgi:hypothetical protein
MRYMTAPLMVVAIGAIAIVVATPAPAHESWINSGNYTPKPIKGGFLLENDEAVREAEIMRVSPETWFVCRRPDGSRRCVFAPMQSW